MHTALIHVSSTQIYHGLWPLGFILSALLERYVLGSENPAKALVSLELEIWDTIGSQTNIRK